MSGRARRSGLRSETYVTPDEERNFCSAGSYLWVRPAEAKSGRHPGRPPVRDDRLDGLICHSDAYRVLIAAGRLVRAYAVTAQLCADGAVELLSLHLDTAG